MFVLFITFSYCFGFLLALVFWVFFLQKGVDNCCPVFASFDEAEGSRQANCLPGPWWLSLRSLLHLLPSPLRRRLISGPNFLLWTPPPTPHVPHVAL